MNSVESFASIEKTPRRWLITGVAGFIGSHLLETLLRLKQPVVGIDNFVTGSKKNLDDVKLQVGNPLWAKFQFVEGDIANIDTCRTVSKGVEIILHQAALGSVPRSVENPQATTIANVLGTANVFFAGYQSGVKRIVYASSSSVYGDDAQLPKLESRLGQLLSPYAASKRTNELYAESFAHVYGLETIGLRYFNVFGPRQDPDGPYAAVIPRWIQHLENGEPCTIHGDGKTSRDFCYVDNAVQANLLAAVTTNKDSLNRAYNVALGEQTSLIDLHKMLATAIATKRSQQQIPEPTFGAFRPGDIRHSLADITNAKTLLGYSPNVRISEGITRTVDWFLP